jgi:hypothetical protein
MSTSCLIGLEAGDVMPKNKFSKDIDELLLELKPKFNSDIMSKMVQLRDRLVQLKKQRVVKINHSILELLVSKYLLESGYDVYVEEPVHEGSLIADILAYRRPVEKSEMLKQSIEQEILMEKSESLLVEIETGFVPPFAALNPGGYRQARIAAKIARYSCLTDRFALGAPFYHLLQIPRMYLRSPKERTEAEAQKVKALCDTYYRNPRIPLENLFSAELDSVYLIDVDNRSVSRLSARSYLEYLRGPSDLFKAVT